jgi:hypothetical protein
MHKHVMGNNRKCMEVMKVKIRIFHLVLFLLSTNLTYAQLVTKGTVEDALVLSKDAILVIYISGGTNSEKYSAKEYGIMLKKMFNDSTDLKVGIVYDEMNIERKTIAFSIVCKAWLNEKGQIVTSSVRDAAQHPYEIARNLEAISKSAKNVIDLWKLNEERINNMDKLIEANKILYPNSWKTKVASHLKESFEQFKELSDLEVLAGYNKLKAIDNYYDLLQFYQKSP